MSTAMPCNEVQGYLLHRCNKAGDTSFPTWQLAAAVRLLPCGYLHALQMGRTIVGAAYQRLPKPFSLRRESPSCCRSDP